MVWSSGLQAWASFLEDSEEPLSVNSVNRSRHRPARGGCAGAHHGAFALVWLLVVPCSFLPVLALQESRCVEFDSELLPPRNL